MTKLIKRISFFISFLSISCMTTAYASDLHIEGDFEILVVPNGIQINPYLKVNRDTEVRYKLIVNKCGAAGTSKHANSGLIHLVAGQNKDVGGTVSFQHFTNKDHVSMTLKIYKDKKLMTKFSKEYPLSTSCNT